MSTQFTCDDKPTLIAYVYGEVDPAVRTAVDDHLARCSDCAAEVMALGEVRSELGLWMPPEAEFAFQIVKKADLRGANVLRPAAWWSTVPVWAQAAAAVLVFAAGAAIANVQIKSGPDGFAVSTGWMSTQAPVLSAPSDRAAVGAEVEGWKPALVSLERQLRSEIKSSRETATPVAARGPADEATIRRVQQLLADAEQRHSRELATRFIDFTRDINLQRRADMQNMGRLVGQYDEQLLRQRQMINTAFRVSNTPQQ